MFLTSLSIALVLIATPQADPAIIADRLVGTFEMEPPAGKQWEDGCEPRWTMSPDGNFTAEMGENRTYGRWRVEEDSSNLVLESLTNNDQTSCIGNLLDRETIRLHLVVFPDAIWVSTPRTGPNGQFLGRRPFMRFRPTTP